MVSVELCNEFSLPSVGDRSISNLGLKGSRNVGLCLRVSVVLGVFDNKFKVGRIDSWKGDINALLGIIISQSVLNESRHSLKVLGDFDFLVIGGGKVKHLC